MRKIEKMRYLELIEDVGKTVIILREDHFE